MINRLSGKILVPITWTVLVQVLLTLPGKALPDSGIFSIPNLDKFVHLVMFAGLVGIWCYHFYVKGIAPQKLKWIFFVVFLIAGADGILMEFVQRDFIPNRSFDEADIIADLIACSIAYGLCNIRLLKTDR